LIINLTKRIKVIRPEALARFPYSNSLYIDDETKAMIDAGAGGTAYREVPVNDISVLLISHHHFDHINGISFFPNAKVYVGAEEWEGYLNPEVFASYAGLRHWEYLMGNVIRESYSQNLVLPNDIPVPFGFQAISPERGINDGDIIELGKTRVACVHTPGHTHGHYAFFLEKDGILFSGDIDLSPRGPWYGGEFSNLDHLIESIKKLIDFHPDILVTSHRKVFYSYEYDIPSLLKGFLDMILIKEERILKYLGEPRDIEEISVMEGAYAADRQYNIFAAKMMILKHLERLKRLGAVKQLNDRVFVKI